MSTERMTQPAANVQLSAFLDGELDDQEVSAVEAALQTDPDLRAELDRLKSVQHLLRAHGPVRAPEGFAARVIARVEDEVAPAPWWRRPMGFPLEGVLVAAAAALVLFIAIPGQEAEVNDPGTAPGQGVSEAPVQPAATAKASNDAGNKAPALGEGGADLTPKATQGALPANLDDGVAVVDAPELAGTSEAPADETAAQMGAADVAQKAAPVTGATPKASMGNAGYEYTIYSSESDVLLALQRVAGQYQGTVLDERGQATRTTALTNWETQLYVELPAEQVSAFLRQLEALGQVQSVATDDLISGANLRVPITIKRTQGEADVKQVAPPAAGQGEALEDGKR
jgi:hypothetical protein